MRLDSIVIHKGTPCLLRGLQPVSVPDPKALIEHPESGELAWVPVEDLVAEDDEQGVGGARVVQIERAAA